MPTELLALGFTADKRSQFDIARQALRQLVTQPDDSGALAAVLLGLLEQEQGESDAARAAYRQAINTGHADHAPAAAFNLGVLEHATSRPGAASHET